MTAQLSSSATSNPTLIPLAQATDPAEVGHKAATLASARASRVTTYAGDGAAPRLAVLVQPMVPAVAAGVAFTADPVIGDRDVVVIDAVRGLGEQLVSGAVTPDRWEVRGEARQLSAPSSETPAIDATTACAVAALARRAEQVLGAPQDVEWALTGAGTLVLLQSRPVTTLPDEAVRLIPLAVEPPEGFWVREVSHAPLPWTAFTHAVFEARNRGLRQMCTELGLLVETIEFRNIGGWEYLRIVPLGGKQPPPLPSWAASLALRVVPSLRRRLRSSVAAIRSDVPGGLIRRWAQDWQPDLAARIAALREVDLAVLESEFDRLQPGDVLVCPVTSPVWSVLFPSIGALVTDIGGMLSHPAIIAREYHLPAVVATGDGTSRLTDGQIVTVDGIAGTVRTAS